MVTLDKTIRIRAAPERVFEEITRVARAPRWHAGTLRAAPASPGEPLREGAAFRLVEEALGLRLRSEALATAVLPNRRFAWRQVEGDYERHEASYDLETEEDGRVTRLRMRMRVELPFVLPWMVREEEVARHLSGREDRALLRLKEICELA